MAPCSPLEDCVLLPAGKAIWWTFCHTFTLKSSRPCQASYFTWVTEVFYSQFAHYHGGRWLPILYPISFFNKHIIVLVNHHDLRITVEKLGILKITIFFKENSFWFNALFTNKRNAWINVLQIKWQEHAKYKSFKNKFFWL
jgi:hypothetical protein